MEYKTKKELVDKINRLKDDKRVLNDTMEEFKGMKDKILSREALCMLVDTVFAISIVIGAIIIKSPFLLLAIPVSKAGFSLVSKIHQMMYDELNHNMYLMDLGNQKIDEYIDASEDIVTYHNGYKLTKGKIDKINETLFLSKPYHYVLTKINNEYKTGVDIKKKYDDYMKENPDYEDLLTDEFDENLKIMGGEGNVKVKIYK